MTGKELEKFETGPALRLRDGELVSLKGESTIYFVSGGTIRPFDSYETFENMGFDPVNIVYVDKKTLDLHTLGELITQKNK